MSHLQNGFQRGMKKKVFEPAENPSILFMQKNRLTRRAKKTYLIKRDWEN